MLRWVKTQKRVGTHNVNTQILNKSSSIYIGVFGVVMTTRGTLAQNGSLYCGAVNLVKFGLVSEDYHACGCIWAESLMWI